MITFTQKQLWITVAAFLLTATSHTIAENTPPKKIYTPKERQIEEALIRKTIKNNLDFRKMYEDDPDATRYLKGEGNESILLRQATGDRFGIYTSFNDKDNTSNYEIRFHRNRKITARFRHHYYDCDAETLSVEEITDDYILFKEICRREKKLPIYVYHLYHFASDELYRLSIGVSTETLYSGPMIALNNGVYTLYWDLRGNGNDRSLVMVRYFKFIKDSNGKWKVEELPPINNKWGAIEPAEKLPLKPEYDLPSNVKIWGKQ